jgi:ATP-binding cassette subfamily B protein
LSFNDFWGLFLTSAIAIVIMVRIDPWITLATVAPIAAIVFLVKLARERVNEYRRQNREATSDVTGALGEIFGAAQAIQVAGAEARVIAHFRRLNERRGHTAIRDRVLTALIDAFSSNMVIIGTGLVLLSAARAVDRGAFTVGDFALFTTYLWPIAQFLRNITGRLVAWQQSRVSLARMQGLLAGAPESTLVERQDVYLFEEAPLPTPPERAPSDRLERLEATGLTCTYAPGDQGVHDVDLVLTPGEFVVVTGRVGAGKTTLLRALLGLLPLDAGTISWNGAPVPDPAAWFKPPRCAYTPQVPRLFSDTLRENILLGLPPDEVPLGDAIAAAELAADVAGFEHGPETRVGAKGTRLSGGQVQRAAAARALVRRPALYVFDDLSSALDVETELRLWRNVAAWQPQAAFLVVSHRQPVLRQADRIVLLVNGRLAASGSLEELLERYPEMRAIWSGEA